MNINSSTRALLASLFFVCLLFACETQDDVDSWKASFLRAGVYPEKSSEIMNGEEVRLLCNNIKASLKNQLGKKTENVSCLILNPLLLLLYIINQRLYHGL